MNRKYHNASNNYFGNIAPYTGAFKKILPWKNWNFIKSGA